jgi:hypothetical protein
MPLDFPASPTNGQTYTSAGITWTYSTTYGTWDVSSAGPAGPTGFTGSQGPIGYTGSGYGTSASVQMGSLGVGTPASGTTGEIRATNNVTAYYSSDKRFKENIKPIENATNKIVQIGGVTFSWTDEYINNHGGADGYFIQKDDFGVIAQDVERVFPLAVRKRVDGSLAVDYEKLCALAFQAISEQNNRMISLEQRILALESSNKG